MKICYVLSHRNPNYIRTRVLLDSLRKIPEYEIVTAINTRRGILRFVETLLKLLWVRFAENPDIYILGFRGQEIFTPVRLLTLGKPLIYDHFVCGYDSIVNESKFEWLKISEKSILAKLLWWAEKTILNNADFILEDTKLHEDLAIKLFGIDPNKIDYVFVGTDEGKFKNLGIEELRNGKEFGNLEREELRNNEPCLHASMPPCLHASMPPSHHFTIFYYGDFHLLHGFEYIFETAKKLRDLPIYFTVGVGKAKGKRAREFLRQVDAENLPNFEYLHWIPFEKLPDYIRDADLCLGGPFGGTGQARRVIGGKTFQFLAMGKTTVIGKLDWDVGFRDKENCLLVDQADASQLEDAILWAYNNQGRLGEIGRKGRELYDRQFSNKEIAKKLKTIIEGLMQNEHNN